MLSAVLVLAGPATFPLIVMFVNVGELVVAIGCGVDKVIEPEPFVTITSSVVPVNDAAVGAFPVLPIIT
jgi:hypothetical protein